MTLISRRVFVGAGAALVVAPRMSRAAAVDCDLLRRAINKGRDFLASLLDDELGLLPEFRGSQTYWLFHDNYLAKAVLKDSHPRVAGRIDEALRGSAVREAGKIEIVLGEARRPLPFRRHKLVDVKRVGDKTIKTEIVADEPLGDWRQYADLLLLAAIAQAGADRDAAESDLDKALATWDGVGFRDRVVEHAKVYATYKLALGLLAQSRLKTQAKTQAMQSAIVARLLAMQRSDGGWITDYDANGKPVGEANVETTSLAILGLAALCP